MTQLTALCSPEDIAESMEPAPACYLDTGMAGEQSWGEVNAAVRKHFFVLQPANIIAEEQSVHAGAV